MDKTKREIIDALKTLSAAYPDLRFGQLISCISLTGDDFYVTDDKYLEHLKSVIKNGFPIQG